MVYDVVIVGGGPAGLVAGLYSARARMNIVLIEKLNPGGQAAMTEMIENYPGFPDIIAGPKLMERMLEQSKRMGLEIINDEVVGLGSRLQGAGSKKLVVKTKDRKEYEALAVIVASGASPRKLGAPGEERLCGKGVSFCATCDGPLFKDKDVVVVGGGNAAIEEALYLARFAKTVTVIHRRSRLRADRILQEKAKSEPKIGFALEAVVTEILGKEKLEGVRIKDIKGDKEKDIPCEGVFIYVGIEPNSKFLEDVVEIDQEGCIITDENMKTSCRGVYACGDVRKRPLRQIVTACGEGAIAAVAAQHYVEELKGIVYK